MNIYKLSQEENYGYDTYDSCIVIAENEREAITIHPARTYNHNDEDYWESITWVENPKDVHVELIGVADERFKKPGVICASFNAG